MGAMAITAVGIWTVAPWGLWMSFGWGWTIGWLIPTTFLLTALWAPAPKGEEITFEEAPDEVEPDEEWESERELPVELVEWLDALHRGPSRRCRLVMTVNNWLLALAVGVLMIEQWWFLMIDVQQMAGWPGIAVGGLIAAIQIFWMFRALDARWARRSMA